MANTQDPMLRKVSDEKIQRDPSMTTDTTQTTNVEEVSRDETLAPGDVAGEYTIKQKIGWGGCSTVYAAMHSRTGQKVAVKVMHPGLAESPKQVKRFRQEAHAVRLIEHSTIVDIYDIGRMADGRPYIVMELIEGTNLAALIQTRGRFSAPEALEILAPIAEALSLAHKQGIIHRDIKASNIILRELGDERQVKLLDFGIAKLVGPSAGGMQTTIGHVLGTPHSMAPEQIRGLAIDGRTDIYALGALLYRLLTGKHPFDGCDAITLTRMHVHTPPPPPSQSAPVTPRIDAVVRRAMEKDPQNRYDSPLAFVEALREAIGQETPKVEERVRAIGLFTEVRVEAGGETDDELLDDLMGILDIAEQVLEDNGFLIPLQTGNAILGALIVADEEGEDEVRDRVMDVATELDAELQDRPDADDRVDINICLHVATASVRRSAEGIEIVGGPILDVGEWAPQHTIDGVCATPATLGMALEARDKNARSYVRIGTMRHTER